MKVATTIIAACLILFLSCAGKSSGEQFLVADNEITQGALRVETEEGKILEFPLKHSAVKAEISGFISYVEVTQYFENPFKEPIEAVYVFPLPQNSAVNDMLMKIGSRTIRGIMKKREEARKIYEAAKAAGKTASLLEQQRPNIFTQSLANILPGDKIQITIRYIQDLTYDNGQYEFVFPMVVGPRYIPGDSVGKTGSGWSPDTDRVPDGSKITPPVLKPNRRSGHDIELSLKIDAGIPIQNLVSPSHQIDIKKIGKSQAEVKIKPNDSIPNKDFILRYNVSGKKPEAAVLTHSSELGNYFMMMIQPKAEFKLDEITPKEMIFVVDCSGSMSGRPLAKAKEAMRRCIEGMNPDDTFQIFRFSMKAVGFSAKPLPNTPENVKQGLQFIDQMRGQGGTEMLAGIRAALNTPSDPSRMRIIFFMTDGYIGNENEILAAIKADLKNSRLFSFGVGSSVNRYLLDRMAEVGRGTVQYVRPDEDTKKAVTKFYNRISMPYLTDIEIDWNGLETSGIYPYPIPDLFSAQPVIFHGKYPEPGKATIKLKGKVAGKPYEMQIKVSFPKEQAENKALATLWARTRIKNLMAQMYRGESSELVEQVTNLAIQFRLMSKYTAFVAVEEQVRNEGGKLIKVLVPVEMPEDVSYEGVFGESHKKGASFGSSRGRNNILSLQIVQEKSYRSMPAPVKSEAAPQADIMSEEIGDADLGGYTDIEQLIDAELPTKAVLLNLIVESKIKLIIGDVDSIRVQKALIEIAKNIRKNYTKLCAQSHPQAGHVLIWLAINGNGKVERIKMKSSAIQHSEIEAYIINKLKNCKFPGTKDKGKAYLTISFEFSN